MANLLNALISEDLTFDDFQKLTFILNNLNPSSYLFISRYFEHTSSKNMNELIEGEAFLIASGIGTVFENQLKLTKTGVKLYEFGIKPLKKASN